jgi:hypothetical protein
MPLAEGQVGEFANVGGVPYTAVTSCLTVTCKIAGVADTYVGGHLSLQVPDHVLSRQIPDVVTHEPADRSHVCAEFMTYTAQSGVAIECRVLDR